MEQIIVLTLLIGNPMLAIETTTRLLIRKNHLFNKTEGNLIAFSFLILSLVVFIQAIATVDLFLKHA